MGHVMRALPSNMLSSLTALHIRFCILDGPVFAPLEACTALRSMSLQHIAVDTPEVVASLLRLTQV